MDANKKFRPYERDQLMLLPPDLQAWLPEDHMASFICDVVSTIDLKAIYDRYDGNSGGQPPYDPRMMVSLLVYAYCIGTVSSRKIERQTYDSVAFRFISADQHPDHDTIANFRSMHLPALSGLFVEVLQLCRAAGLVKLGHVSLDGTKMKANASKHKAMSYGRMEKKERELQEEVDRLLAEAEVVDAEEDTRYGKGKRGDELPEELRFKQSRLKKIREAKEMLEREAKAAADVRRGELAERERQQRETGKTPRGRKPKAPSDKPEAKAQRNFTDPDSRIMKDGATKAFAQCYNAQAVVDAGSQVIVAATVTQESNDKQQLKPMLEKMLENLDGEKPGQVSADSGYFSEANIEYLEEQDIDGFLAVEKDKHGEKPAPPRGRIPADATKKQRMQRKLQTVKGRRIYSKRKEIVEPVFGQIKNVRGLRQFLFRGVKNVTAEWDLICIGHNLLKLYRSGWRPGGI